MVWMAMQFKDNFFFKHNFHVIRAADRSTTADLIRCPAP